jgi:hypothetical protein
MPFMSGILVVVPLGLVLFAVATYIVLMYQIFQFLFFAVLILAIVGIYAPYLKYNDWRKTQYVITNQRVFFDTMVGYAVINLTDVREVFVRRRVLDRLFGTNTLVVTYRDFQPATTYNYTIKRPVFEKRGRIYIKQGYPSFSSIKNAEEAKEVLLQAVSRAQFETQTSAQVTEKFNKSTFNGEAYER